MDDGGGPAIFHLVAILPDVSGNGWIHRGPAVDIDWEEKCAASFHAILGSGSVSTYCGWEEARDLIDQDETDSRGWLSRVSSTCGKQFTRQSSLGK